MKKLKKLISNYGFWTGLSAAVVMLATSISKACGVSIDNKVIEDIIMSVCGILVVFGIVSIPPTKKEQTQTKTEENSEQKVEENQTDCPKQK